MATLLKLAFGSLLLLPSLFSTGISAPTGLSTCTAAMDDTLPTFQPTDFEFSGNIRRYYIAAEQVLWDYVPSGWDNFEGVPLKDSYRAAAAGLTAEGSLGTKWQKALYRGYTDATFTTPLPEPAWNGANGPTLRGEVGDMIEILFVNNLPKVYATMHSMGLAYNKDNEGSLYPNNTAPGQDGIIAPGDAVAPGDCVVYKWLVNNGSAPTQGAVSHMWAYHSYIAMDQDMFGGLIGSTIVYAPGQMNAVMESHREFVLVYMQYDESNSIMSAVNKQYFTGNNRIVATTTTPTPTTPESYGNSSIWEPQIVNFMSTGQLNSTQAPTFSALNGLILANNAPFEVCVNDPTIWYVSAFGDNPHVFHMHGNGFVHNGDNMAALSTSLSFPPSYPSLSHVDS
jgi:manganese oxidase